MGWFSWWCLLFLLSTTCQFNSTCSSSSNSSSSLSSGHLCHSQDSSALLQFKNSFSIHTHYLYSDRTISWQKGKDCCTWSGITCEKITGHVIGLNLSFGGLQGNIHSNSSLFSLGLLKRLDLSANDFRGSPISSKFGGFVSMTHLDLSYSHFSGPIPSQISLLSNLVSLNLSMLYDARLDTLSMNRIVQNLTNLRELDLAKVDMSSVVPDSFKNLSSSITTLRLYDCHLQGKFPESIFLRPNLQLINLHYNYNLTGYFPKSNWSSPLKVLDLSNTRISVDWHHLTRNFKSLRDLCLSNCSFVGSYLAFLGNLTQIMRLDLSSNSFGGQIPWSFFFNLESLVALNLGGNNFVGQFPKVVNNSTTISSLYDFSKQQLVGPIPRHLTELHLYGNQLNGTIPSWLGSLPSLDVLSLRSNQLSGNIIEFQSRSLSVLGLRDNKLDGLIPRSIYELVNLTWLDLSSNNLGGNLEFEKFSKLRSLSGLNLSSNHLSLSFNHLSNNTWPQLELLDLSYCNISEFPYFLKASHHLRALHLSHNRIKADIPKWLLDLDHSLYYLDLSHNFLTGIARDLRWKNLRYLNLRNNSIQGDLPIPPPSTSFLSISNNKLTGEMPPTICSLSRLEILDLSNNELSGKIHQCIGNFSQSLSVLDLRNNKFQGVIPGTFSKGNVLRNLDLNGNQLEGSLPPTLRTCRELEVLDLGNNKIQDTFPNWLESLPKLQVLILRSNKFYGGIGIPETKFPFQKLRIMDLSYNRFSGLLPTKYFEHLTAMINSQEHELKYMGEGYYHDTVVVTIKGSDIEMVKIQTFFTTIDFSSNNFTGEISNVIGKLKSLKGLNFSHNELTGTIPLSFGYMSNLEWLDLSSNRLVGDIPKQLANLTFLSKFNVSKNRLEGPIPRGKQFDTFENDSYSGNTELCGLPLSKTCNAHQSLPSSFQQADDLEYGNGFDWKVVLIGYASGVVIGISMGYLVLSNRTPNWLVKVVGK